MAKKRSDWKKRDGIVYSTNPDFDYQHEESAEKTTLPPSQQKLRIVLDKRHRKGKAVTLIQGFEGTQDDLATLGKQLKIKCGSGGTAEQGEILIQGDMRQKVWQLLNDMGYQARM